MMPLLRALRPKQWLKNGLVLAPVIFAGHVFELPYLSRAIAGTLLFCAASSGLYILNDISDIERDRAHPRKRHRPFAAGTIPIPTGQVLATILILGSLAIGFYLAPPFGTILGVYIGASLAYSWGLKNVVLIDVFILAAGFVLRAIAGALIIDVAVSDWLLICTMLLALFMVLAKRRHELVILGENAKAHRSVLEHYTPYLLDQMIGIVTAATLVCYCLYTMSDQTIEKFGSSDLKYSIPFVILGIFRYLYLVHQRTEGGAPERVLLTDLPLILTILAWAVCVSVVIYRAQVL